MLSIAKARKDYYLQKLGEISPREDYYLRGGRATGRWRGSGAAEAGVDGTVSAVGLVRLFDGQHAATGEQLGQRPRKDGVAAWDLTFSADKSVSLLWAFGDRDVRQQVVEAFEEATAEAVAYLESVASSTRGASRTPVLDSDGRPVLNDDGSQRYRVETWPIRTHGYVSAWFTEFTSRADDPQLHTHVVVGNRVKGVDGVWRTLDGRLLYGHKLAAGYLHEAELRSRLTKRLGVQWQTVHKGVADIDGFTREQIMAFSQRRQEIEEWRSSRGLADTASANEIATLATRAPKQDHDLAPLIEAWVERGREVGITPDSVAAVLGRCTEITTPDPQRLFDRMASSEGLTAKASTFALADVIQGAAEAMPQGGTRSELEALADAFLHQDEVIPILPLHPDTDMDIEPPAGIDSADFGEALKELKATRRPTLRRRNGDIFPGLRSERRYTTAELLTVEQRVLDRAQAETKAGRWSVDEERLETAVAAHPDLTDGQQAMIRQFATSGSAVDVGVGAAGTGKTTVMGILGQLASDTDTAIVGTALAARAAAGFETATGITSSTITRFLWKNKRSGGLATGTVVVVDEAGMVGSRHLAQISDLVEAACGKLILIGDHRQLAEIDAGGLFAALTHRLPVVELTENVRQHHEWERAALTDLRDGSVARAVAMYDRRGLINLTTTTAEAVEKAVDAWSQDVQSIGDPAQVLLIADRNDTVHKLNQHARSVVGQAGQLTGPVLSTDDRQYQSGDRVVCLKNKARLGVLNGDLGTVISVDNDRHTMTLELDRTREHVTIPAWYLDEKNLDWGYALTGHKAQGATARRAHTVVSSDVDREWFYVTMSRGRDANTIYLPDIGVDNDDCQHLAHDTPNRVAALVSALSDTSSEPSAHDTGRGPQVLTNEKLGHALADTTAGAGTCGDRSVEFTRIHDEAEARFRDQMALVSYDPPPWVVDAFGVRPADPAQRAVWDRVVDRSLRYREIHGISEDAAGLIGPPPDKRDIRRWVEWRAWHRSAEPELRTLNDSFGQGVVASR
jgi:hypothetical protein